MSSRLTRKLLGAAVATLFATVACAEDGWLSRNWNAASTEAKAVADDGKWTVYEPTYVWHLPYAYDSGQRERYNNTPWPAFGVGKGRYTETGNRSDYYVLYYIDSNRKWSMNAGYQYTWQYGSQTGFNYGLGLTGGLMTRYDYFSRKPFPYILPTATLGYANLKAETAFVPGGKRGSGNILFFTLKYELK